MSQEEEAGGEAGDLGWGVRGHGDNASLKPKNYGELSPVCHRRMTQVHSCVVSVPLAADWASPSPTSQARPQTTCSVGVC